MLKKFATISIVIAVIAIAYQMNSAPKDRGEQDAWQFAQTIASAHSYKSFIELYPSGLHALEAATRLQAIEAEQEVWQQKLLQGEAGVEFSDCALCPVMVSIPKGDFAMGGEYVDEQPQHRVNVSHNFAVGKFEVSFAQWDACLKAGGCNGYRPDDVGWGRGQLPVININWHEAKSYVAWLSSVTGQSYRLLTEAEWEYVARAGSQARYSWGDEDPVCQRDQVNGAQFNNDPACEFANSAPIGSFLPNAFGLHDMHGNVWEWVEDCYHASYEGADPDAAIAFQSCDNDDRVLRGGAWYSMKYYLRSANRNWTFPADKNHVFGMRVARSLP